MLKPLTPLSDGGSPSPGFGERVRRGRAPSGLTEVEISIWPLGQPIWEGTSVRIAGRVFGGFVRDRFCPLGHRTPCSADFLDEPDRARTLSTGTTLDARARGVRAGVPPSTCLAAFAAVRGPGGGPLAEGRAAFALAPSRMNPREPPTWTVEIAVPGYIAREARATPANSNLLSGPKRTSALRQTARTRGGRTDFLRPRPTPPRAAGRRCSTPSGTLHGAPSNSACKFRRFMPEEDMGAHLPFPGRAEAGFRWGGLARGEWTIDDGAGDACAEWIGREAAPSRVAGGSISGGGRGKSAASGHALTLTSPASATGRWSSAWR